MPFTIKVFKGSKFLLDFEFGILEGWNIATLAESGPEVFDDEHPGILPEDGLWDIFVNGVKVEEDYEIQPDDKIHFVIPDKVF